jgi:hypothetical protein
VRGVAIPRKFAVMAIDPGETTGVARAFLNAGRARSTGELMRRAVQKGALEVDEIRPADFPGHAKAASASQAARLYRMWWDFQFKANVELSIPYGAIWLVIEDFQLRQRSAELWPVEVTHALLALLRGAEGTWAGIVRPDCLVFQQPSMAMTYATNERLRRWALWTRGKEHGRDATRHLALAASRVLDGELRDEVR